MTDEKDQEIARLKAQLAGQPSPAVAPSKSEPGPSNRFGIVFLLIVGAVAAFLIYAWNVGKESATREDQVAAACRAATTEPRESAQCVQRMDASYIGPMDAGRLANAAAQHVADIKAGD